MLELPVDVWEPRAFDDVLHAYDASRAQARIIIEGANGPTTRDADEISRDCAIMVVRDILANAGGVIVSDFDFVQENQAYRWTAREIDERTARAKDLQLAPRRSPGPTNNGRVTPRRPPP